jgi:hypothetical protein
MGKYSLLVIGGLVLAAGLISSNLNQVSEYFVDDVIEHYERAEARLVANSMAHMSLVMLRDSSRGGMDTAASPSAKELAGPRSMTTQQIRR